MPRKKKKITPQNKKPEPGRKANGMGSLRQKTVKGNTYWEGRFSVIDPLTGKVKQRSVSGKTEAEVYKKMAKAQTEINERTYIEPSKMTVGQWLDNWLTTYLKDVKPYTVLNYTQHINNHIKPALGTIRLDKLETQDIQNFYNDLEVPHDGKPGLSPKTVKCINGVLHGALQQAVDIGYLRKNPTNACRLTKVEKKMVKPLKDAEIRAFLEAIREHRFGVLYLVTLFTGMRRGEVCGLTWDCVNLDCGTILVNKQLRPVPNHPGEFQIVPTKNSKQRTIAVADPIIERLRQYKAQQIEARAKAGVPWRDNGFVFADEAGHHLSPNTVYHNFKRIAASIGLPEARLHDLRHSYAVISIRAGDKMKTIQEHLGHYSIAFTMDTYGHVTEDMQRESVERMNQYIQGISGT